MTFAERLRYLREEKSMTQNELAKMLNISRQSICNYESGTRFPNDVQILINLSQIFSVSLDYLVGISNIRFQVTDNNSEKFLQHTNAKDKKSVSKKKLLEDLFYEIDSMSMEEINKLVKIIYVCKGKL